jgi:hypothetical protein
MSDLKKRTWHYVQNPAEYGIQCDLCNGENIAWSEYEHCVWCFDCKKDTKGTEGVFGGPIPIMTSAVLGMSFDRWDMVNQKVIPFEVEEK